MCFGHTRLHKHLAPQGHPLRSPPQTDNQKITARVRPCEAAGQPVPGAPSSPPRTSHRDLQLSVMKTEPREQFCIALLPAVSCDEKQSISSKYSLVFLLSKGRRAAAGFPGGTASRAGGQGSEHNPPSAPGQSAQGGLMGVSGEERGPDGRGSRVQGAGHPLCGLGAAWEQGGQAWRAESGSVGEC